MLQTSSRLPGWVVLLGTLTALGPLSIDMYLPAFPAIEHDLGHGAQLTLASFFIGLAVGQLLYGPVSDRFGRKPPLYVGLALYVLASLGCVFAASLDALIALRFVQALGGCAGMVITRAIVRDRCDARQAAQVFAMLMLVMGLAPILAPLLGGWLLTVTSWHAIFAAQALFAAMCLIAVHRLLAESHDTRDVAPLRLGQVLRGYGRLLTHRGFIGYVLTGGLAQAGMFGYIAGSPTVLIEQYGIAPQHYGWVFGLNALGLIAASQLNARQLKSQDLTVLLRRALWVPLLATLALLTQALSGLAPLAGLLLCFFAYLTSLGYINPNATAAALASQGQHAGSASALIGSLQFSIATVAAIAVEALHDGTPHPLAIVMAACGIGAFVAHRLLARASHGS
ncbi:multidrug effflux MFS transporter [Chitinolyticbacter meiyuanensis]|uniref:multidrug effflux MFS transporter n=1 Tax=Chitinolyticbacter meiyuanensis TaxID=682798 RepID=UPI0011E5EB9E|nr:multidrug effflux MFS transporter [Chitinolyticbacter meiyuanensis]